MNVNGQAGTWRRLGAWLLCAALCFAISAGAADSLTWNKQTDRVDAQIESWEITRLLEEITEATGWKVFMEPGTKQTVSVKFKNNTSGDALSKLFGDLSYALLPQSDGPDKLFVFRNSRESATQEVLRRAKAKGKPIPNELVLTLKAGAGESPEDLAKRLGAKIANRADGLNAYRLQFEDEEAANKAREALQGNQDVESVDSNYEVSRPYEPESLGAETLPALSLKATGGPNASQFIVGLVDTKVQTAGTPYGDFLLPTKSVAGEYKPDNSSPTHGTSMLETLLRGLAQTPSLGDSTSVKVLPVDVYGGGATTSTFEVAKGILEAINGGSSVINMSLGSDGDSQLMHNVIKQAYDKGILLVAAAGNQSTAAPTYPAAYNEVLAVTAGKNGNIASYANYGNFVDVVAPGSSVVYFNGQSYLVSGTSAASAYISGFASGLSTKSGQKPQAVGTQLSSMFGRKTK